MEMKLDNLIQKIKQEGVEEAKKQSEDIVNQAQTQAKKIIENSEDKRKTLIQEGRREASNLMTSGEEALRQAARDVLLSLRQEIIKLFDRVTKDKVSEELSPDSLEKIIVKVIENFKREEGLDIEVLLSKEDKKVLEAVLLKALSGDLKKGVTFKAAAGMEKGFRVGEKDKNFYYDFSDEAIAEAFGKYLNPRIAEILKG